MMQEHPPWLPEFTLRHSDRACKVSLRINPAVGLELVVPRRMSEKKALQFLYDSRSWIEKHAHFLKALPDETTVNTWPEQIDFHAVALSWQLTYETMEHLSRIELKESENKLVFVGPVTHWDQCKPLFDHWLKEQAQVHIAPWMNQLSEHCQLKFNQLTFRGQKTRWGSCSSDKNISLNYKLLFFPARLMRYVLIHELCHIKHLNHSKHFWALVARYEPDYVRLKKELRQAEQYIPSCAI